MAPPAGAFSFPDIFGNVKDLFKPNAAKEFKVQSNIELVGDGDVNKNGQIDAGDIVRFSYAILNTTDQDYTFGILKTHIDRKQINFIHNVKGSASLSDNGETIEIPNLRMSSSLDPMIISFDARINYIHDKDIILTTEPEFISKENKSIVKAVRQEKKASKIRIEDIPKTLERRER